MNKSTRFILSAAATLALSACGNAEWNVEGNIDGGKGHLLALEASHNGRWYQLDTMTLKSDKFEFSGTPAGFPDIYRLTMDGKSIYFPIDSIETVSITANVANFSSEYTLEGSDNAKTVMDVDKLIANAVRKMGEKSVILNDSLKRELTGIILSDPSSIVAYYIVNKRVSGVPLFNANVKTDLRIIGAVANAYVNNRPSDPRTEYLKSVYLSNKVAQNVGEHKELEVAQTHIFEISLYNPEGEKVSLVETASNGKVVLLNFTAMLATESPAFNVRLASIYDEFKSKGFEIYQVSVDEDEFAWKAAAKNLPWISVYAGPNDMKCLVDYNVNIIPALYVIDRNGEIAERITDLDKIKSTVSKYL